MPQPAATSNDRKKQLRSLSYLLVFFLILYWVCTYFLPDEYSGLARHWIKESPAALAIGIGVSLLILTLCCFLYNGNEDGWWGVFFLIYIVPSAIMLMFVLPMSGVVVFFLFNVLYQTRPSSTMVSSSIPSEVDELASAMNVQWEEQPLWHLVSLAKQGKVDDAVKTLRSTHHMTWDQADQAIRRWKDDELGLKLYLLKLHAQSLPVATELMMDSASPPHQDGA